MNNFGEKVYLGSRGSDFKSLITGLLSRGRLKRKYIDILTDEVGMQTYGQAFTAFSADEVDNYERFEQLGDVTANKIIVWYAYKRFPQLDCTQGVKVVARLRINYGAKVTFASIADNLGFWDFISAAEEGTRRGTTIKYRTKNKKDLLEDTFEAFIGCTEYLLDKAFRPGVGYGIVYDIMASIFDNLNISLKFEDLYDAKTRLKETFDAYPQLGDWKFEDSRDEIADGYSIANTILYYRLSENRNGNRGWSELSRGTAASKGEAQQRAAEQGLKVLKRMGFYRDPPDIYKYFCN